MSDSNLLGGAPKSGGMGKNPDITGWEAFRLELISFMNLRDMTAQQVAESVADSRVTAETVRQWRRPTRAQRPSFDLLPSIAASLSMNDDDDPRGVDYTYLPRRMGILPTSGINRKIDLVFDVAKLTSRLNRIEDRFRELGETGGLGKVVETAMRSREWAVASWPAVEGFTENEESYELHVADRLDFRKVDGTTPSPLDTLSLLEDQLPFVTATRTGPTQPRWPTPGRAGQNEEAPIGSAAHWSINYLGRPRSSIIDFPFTHVPHVAVTSLTVHSWAHDVAAHIAQLIGYGLTSTRELAILADGPLPLSLDGEERAEFQRLLLENPRPKQVWSHWSTGSDTAELLTGTEDDKIFHLYIKQDDSSLLREVKRRKNSNERTGEDLNYAVEAFNEDEVFEFLKRRRNDVESYIADREGTNFAKYDGVILDSDASNSEVRSATFKRCFEIATDVVADWCQSDLVGIARLRSLWSQRPDPHRDTLTRYFYARHPEFAN